MPVASFVATGTACAAIRSLLAREGPAFPEERRSCSPSPQAPHPFPSALFRENETMRGRRAFPASTVPRKPQQQKMRICSIAKGPLKERAFLLAYEMASGNLKHCARVGRDAGLVHQHDIAIGVSIHGPRGARQRQAEQSSPKECFNPRARVGRDSCQGARNPASTSFNPRARAGRDSGTFSGRNPVDMFQSTRPRGARQRHLQRAEPRRYVSIHAPARGATTVIIPSPAMRAGFNPRARAGRDLERC